MTFPTTYYSLVSEEVVTVAVSAVIALVIAVFLRQRGWGIALPLIAAGAIVDTAPFGPDALPEPELILVLILAPLVFGEALGSSFFDLRKVKIPVLALAIGLVIATTVVVGGVVSALVAMPIAVALALGAILAPTDAVAVSTIAKRAAIPRRLVSILEGESLVNDGTGLTALRVAVATIVVGSVTWLDVAGMFGLAVGVGLAVGAVSGWILARILATSKDLVAANSLILVAPFVIYLGAERLEGSGILAVVVAALWVANSQHRDPGWSGRVQGNTVWRHVTFVLQALAFFFVGLELPSVLVSLTADEASLVGLLVPVVVLALIVTRALFVFLMVVVARTSRKEPGIELIRRSMILAWAGARGPISGLAAFSLPLLTVSGESFPYRNVLIATSLIVVVITLLLSLTVAPLARVLRITGDEDRELASALDVALARAALDRLDAAVEEAASAGEPIPPVIIDALRVDAANRLDRSGQAAPAHPSEEVTRVRIHELTRVMIRAEQEELVRLRDEEGFPDALVRPRLRDLDVRLQGLDTAR